MSDISDTCADPVEAWNAFREDEPERGLREVPIRSDYLTLFSEGSSGVGWTYHDLDGVRKKKGKYEVLIYVGETQQWVGLSDEGAVALAESIYDMHKAGEY